MKSIRRAGFRILLSMLVFASPHVVLAYGITISTPTNDSTWSANAQLASAGGYSWTMNNESQPGWVSTFLHAGGASGVITTSKFADNTTPADPLDGTGTWQSTFNIVPSDPLIGGGNGAEATYVVEAGLFASGGQVKSAYSFIQVVNG